MSRPSWMMSEAEEKRLVQLAHDTMPKVTVMGRSGWWALASVGYHYSHADIWRAWVVYGGDGDL